MATYLLVWNPKRWYWDDTDIDKTICDIENGIRVIDRWSCGNSTKIEKGDRVFIIRLGQEPKGIFASGIITEESFEAPHWDHEQAEAGKHARFIELQYDTLIHPGKDPLLPRDILINDPRFSQMHWDSQMSGIQIPDMIAAELEQTWIEFTTTNEFTLAEEFNNKTVFQEGAKQEIIVNAYERNPAARQKCIEYYGVKCVVCGFNFEETYGEIGKGFIHVHHLTSLAEIGENYEVDPVNDMRPVCPNCHAMIHKRKPAFSIEDIRHFLSTKN